MDTFYLERVIGGIFVLVYVVRFIPNDPRFKAVYTTNLPLIVMGISMIAVLLTVAPIPKSQAMTAYLFFLMHALNIYKEYAKSDECDVWQVKYVFAVLLAIATALFHATTSLIPPPLPPPSSSSSQPYSSSGINTFAYDKKEVVLNDEANMKASDSPPAYE